MLPLLATSVVRTDRCGGTIWMVVVSCVMVLLLLHRSLSLVCSTYAWRRRCSTRTDNITIAAKGCLTAHTATTALLMLSRGGVVILFLFGLIAVAVFALSSICIC